MTTYLIVIFNMETKTCRPIIYELPNEECLEAILYNLQEGSDIWESAYKVNHNPKHGASLTLLRCSGHETFYDLRCDDDLESDFIVDKNGKQYFLE